MWFCPFCSNILCVETTRFVCATCPFKRAITEPRTQRFAQTRKTVDDVLGGADAWDNVDKTAATCPKCNHAKAYFQQIQIRSADEPMSVFYKCVECSHQWCQR